MTFCLAVYGTAFFYRPVRFPLSMVFPSLLPVSGFPHVRALPLTTHGLRRYCSRPDQSHALTLSFPGGMIGSRRETL